MSTVPFPTSRQTLFPEIQVFFRGKRLKLCCRLGPRSQTWQLCARRERPLGSVSLPGYSLRPSARRFLHPCALPRRPTSPATLRAWVAVLPWMVFWDQGVLRQLLKRLGPRIAQPCGFHYTRSLSKAGIVLYSPSGARGISSWSWLWGSALGVSWRATPAVGRARRARLGQRT